MNTKSFILLVGLAALPGVHAQTTRIQDIARLQGVRSNQLVGYGLIVGLAGSGDSKQTIFTTQSTTSMLSRFGIQVPQGTAKIKNVAAVMITAELPPFSRSGDQIDVLVSSIGDATSLQGGTLLQAPLLGADNQVYAVAQGAVSIGGFSAGGGGGSVTQNHPTAGRVPNGALVEQEVPMVITDGTTLAYSLRQPDFDAAVKIAKAITLATGAKAVAEDAGRVRVDIPEKFRATPSTFVAQVNQLTVQVEPVAKIVINERTGTIVIGGAVRLSSVAVAHGNLTVSVSTDSIISQPLPLSKGKTVATSQQNVAVTQEQAATMLLKPGDTVEGLVRALNAIKASPRDIIAILQAIKEAGGLHGELEIL